MLYPGATLEFRTSLGKVGERVGFCSGDIVEAQTGSLVAAAEHTKCVSDDQHARNGGGWGREAGLCPV